MEQVTPLQVYTAWLAALRSGKYSQCTGILRECEYSTTGDAAAGAEQYKVKKVHGYCCLGVLEDLAVKAGGPGWNSKTGVMDDDSQPRQVIQDFLGLDEEMISHLIEMNDDDGATFEEIADEIEYNIMPAVGVV